MMLDLPERGCLTLNLVTPPEWGQALAWAHAAGLTNLNL